MIDGPVKLLTPGARPEVIIGDSVTYDVPVYNGAATAAKTYGDAVDLSSATVSGELKIQNPDGTADVTVAASKVDTLSSGFVDTFRFAIAKTVTATWVAGFAAFRVKYVDSTGSVERTVQRGELLIVVDPTAAA